MDADLIDIDALWRIPGILPPRIRTAAPQGFRELPLWDPFEAYVGPFFMDPDGPPQRAAFIVREDHLDASGVCDQGMLLTFIDSCSATTAYIAAGRKNAVTIGLGTEFAEPARIGAMVTFVCDTRMLVYDIVLLAARLECGGDTIALTNSRWKVLADD